MRLGAIVRRREQHSFQLDQSIVRSCNHDGLQPVPSASATAADILRADEVACGHRAQARREARVLHVVGLFRPASDDDATGRRIYDRRKR